MGEKLVIVKHIYMLNFFFNWANNLITVSSRTQQFNSQNDSILYAQKLKVCELNCQLL